MRLQIILSPVNESNSLTFNYQYYLASAIYELLNHADKAYAEQLHEKGLVSRAGKPLKLFTFSKLFIPNREIRDNRLIIHRQFPCSFYLSSPLVDSFVKNIVISVFEQQRLTINNIQFDIVNVEPIKTPEFKEKNKFTCLSPFVLSKKHEHKGRISPYYLRHDDSDLSEALRNNLIHKFQTLYQREPESNELHIEIDPYYLSTHSSERISKLITLKEGQGAKETKIKGIFAPFFLKGSIELTKIAWEAGLGEHCSQGFGCIDVIN